ncbi:Probable RNA-directed DNA polymerase from transposon BS [Eumeta japonica]|uniref:Probable RNA-directed DNA polymerase from transposon BS n=1 Tax=Eumeta variegata TaxID=151549 RepID=A0A4C1UF90_EUMVA|nr:Probable RNA-directed DNA polymerase from transposon BS [Eumeta japonica]
MSGRSKVITISKPGRDSRSPSNRRPFTLLSYVTKTFERALLKRLNPFLSPRQEQYGFRTSYSTTLQLIWLLHHIASEMNCRRHMVAVFLDMKKTFDRMWHNGLLCTLLNTSLHPALALYADDSAYFTSSRRAELVASKIQQIFDLLPEWLDRWRMAINVICRLHNVISDRPVNTNSLETFSLPHTEGYKAPPTGANRNMAVLCIGFLTLLTLIVQAQVDNIPPGYEWNEDTASAYKLMKVAQTWNKAKSLCEAEGTT